MTIGGIAPSESPQTVVSRLGRPASETRPADFVERVYHYSGFEVGFSEIQVVHLHSTNSAYCTYQGLCPGNPVSRMRTLYGPPNIQPSRPNVAVYWQGGPDCWYEFGLSGGVVASVGMACQP